MKPYQRWVREETQRQGIRKLPAPLQRTKKFTTGFMFRWGSAWVGAHWSGFNKRLCVNLIPFCTVWFVWPGGICPIKSQK